VTSVLGDAYNFRVGDGRPTHLTVDGTDELLRRVRARRRLPLPAERRRIRRQARVSLREMAGALGVSHGTIRNWEAGATPREHRAAYARLLKKLETLGMREAGGPASTSRNDENVGEKPTAA
jgi:DNA-binding transcriptional regulator YiaG